MAISMDEHTLNGLDWPVVCEALRERCHTERAKTKIEGGDFAHNRQAALHRYAVIHDLWRLDDDGHHPPVAAIHDIESLTHRAHKGEVLEPHELVSISHTLDALHQLQRWASDHQALSPTLHEMVEPIDIDIFLMRNLQDSFDPSGELSDSFYPELRTIRSRMEQLKVQVRSVLDGMLNNPALADLFHDKYITDRGGRLVLPIRVQSRKAVGIVHDTSQSGETAFVEPSAVVDQQNELKGLEAELRRTIARILASLSREVGEAHAEVLTSLRAATEVDLAQARSSLGRILRGTLPHVGEDGIVHVTDARHPVLVLRKVEVVPNSLRIDDTHCGVVLTGPNAGGKTITLKTIGLFALMVRAGLPIPAADDARVDWMDPILAIVGDQQNISDDLSTFSSHLVSLRIALDSARPGALVLLDELGVGTDPAQGAALAQSIVETLVAHGARTIVTTHYAALKERAAKHPTMALMGAVFADGRPTFRLEPDRVGRSHALAVARRMGLPEKVVERARALLDEESQRMDELMTQVESEQEAVRLLRQTLEAQERKLRHEMARTDEREARLNARRDRDDAADRTAFRARLKKQETELKAQIRALQDAPNLRDAQSTLEQVKQVRDEARPAVTPLPPAEERVLNPGDRVKLIQLNEAGIVVSTQGNKVEVEVRGKRMRMVRAALLYAPTQVKHQKKHRPKTVDSDESIRGPQGVRTQGNTLDLRGMRVEEALDAVEAFLDEMILTENGSAFLLHGHGTGALKTALRQWLPKSKYGNRWYRGGPDDGGDAFTVITL
jgi:DNA mismatch repair protein MutS2